MPPAISAQSIQTAGGGAHAWALTPDRLWSVALWGVALLMCLAVAMVPAYLIVRVLDVGQEAWDILLRGSTLVLLARTIALALAVTVTTTVLGVLFAVLTTHTDLPGRFLWTILLPLPLAIPSYIGAFAFISLFGPGGLHTARWGFDIYGFGGAWFTLSLLTYPYVFLPVRAALMGMDPAQLDAARTLGRGSWSTFFQVVVPQLWPAMRTGGLLVALYTISDFGAVSLLRCQTLTWILYEKFGTWDRAGAAVLAMLILVLTLLILGLEYIGRGSEHLASRGHARRVSLSAGGWMRLGRWKSPALLACGLVAGVGLVLPVLTVGWWAVRGVGSAGAVPLTQALWVPALGSVGVSAVTALLAVVLALPLAVLVTRSRSVPAQLMARWAYAGYALPGIVVALAMIYFGRHVGWLYQSLALMLFAYILHFLPQALGPVQAPLLQLNPSLLDAARTLGHGWTSVFRRVLLPLTAPGLWAGGLLVFLTCMKELPITLMLSPPGFDTLATEIWSLTTEAYFARAALPALLLLILSAAPIMMLVAWERPGRLFGGNAKR